MSRYTFSQYDENRDVNISFEAETMLEVFDHFRSFMLASGFQISQEEYIDVVSDEEEQDDLIFLSENNSVGAGDVDVDFTFDDSSYHMNIDPMEYTFTGVGDSDSDSITINLSDTYGTTTSKLKPSEK